MGGESLGSGADRTVAALAGRQHGVVARWQLLRAGVTRRQIERRLRGGRLYELHRGIYLVGHEVAPPYAAETAAVLAARGRGAVGARSAAALWGMQPYPSPGDICVIVPPGVEVVRPGIAVRRSRVAPGDVRRLHGLPVTSPARTILDIAAILSASGPGRQRGQRGRALAPRRLSELEQLIAQAEYARLTTARELGERLARKPGMRGSRMLREILGLEGGAQRTRSKPEEGLVSLLRRHGIGGFEANARIHGYEVDILWRELAFAVEVDGWDGHSGRVAFERDRIKLAQLSARGVDVMPVTPRELRRNPDAVVERIASGVRRRRTSRVRGLPP